jgi:hypothetical protein
MLSISIVTLPPVLGVTSALLDDPPEDDDDELLLLPELQATNAVAMSPTRPTMAASRTRVDPDDRRRGLPVVVRRIESPFWLHENWLRVSWGTNFPAWREVLLGFCLAQQRRGSATFTCSTARRF